MSRWISLLRPSSFPFAISRGFRDSVEYGSMEYSAVSQPPVTPCSFIQRGTPSSIMTAGNHPRIAHRDQDRAALLAGQSGARRIQDGFGRQSGCRVDSRAQGRRLKRERECNFVDADNWNSRRLSSSEGSADYRYANFFQKNAFRALTIKKWGLLCRPAK